MNRLPVQYNEDTWNAQVDTYDKSIDNSEFVGTQLEWLKHKKELKEGWLWVSDTEYSEDNPMVIPAGHSTILTIDALRRLDSTAPEDSIYWWDEGTSAFFPTKVHEMFQLELNFLVKAQQTDKHVVVQLTNATLGAIKAKSYALIRDPGFIERASFDYSIIVTPSILATGIQFELTSNADIMVWKTSLQIHRVFKP